MQYPIILDIALFVFFHYFCSEINKSTVKHEATFRNLPIPHCSPYTGSADHHHRHTHTHWQSSFQPSMVGILSASYLGKVLVHSNVCQSWSAQPRAHRCRLSLCVCCKPSRRLRHFCNLRLPQPQLQVDDEKKPSKHTFRGIGMHRCRTHSRRPLIAVSNRQNNGHCPQTPCKWNVARDFPRRLALHRRQIATLQARSL